MNRIHDLYRPAAERVRDFAEVERPLSDADLAEQTARCLDCGQPFCHAYGCPLGNLVPDQNRAVARGDWRTAWDLLSANSDFPEFTSRVCPALCEGSCVHQLDEESVMIRQSEKRIADRAFAAGWVLPRPPDRENGKSAAIVAALKRLHILRVPATTELKGLDIVEHGQDAYASFQFFSNT